MQALFRLPSDRREKAVKEPVRGWDWGQWHREGKDNQELQGTWGGWKGSKDLALVTQQLGE